MSVITVWGLPMLGNKDLELLREDFTNTEAAFRRKCDPALEVRTRVFFPFCMAVKTEAPEILIKVKLIYPGEQGGQEVGRRLAMSLGEVFERWWPQVKIEQPYLVEVCVSPFLDSGHWSSADFRSRQQ